MSTDPPEYHTKTLSPLSPLPVHPPEPANIPVLRNQIDPIFNMTSTHLDAGESLAPAESNGADVHDEANSPSSDSSFTDAYKDQPGTIENKEEALETAGASDDYAMTFDSDGEDQGAQNQDVSKANIDSNASSIPTNVSIAAVPSLDDAISAANTLPAPDSNSLQAAVPSEQTASLEPISETPLAQQTASSQVAPSSEAQAYEDVATGGVDIQQLLDNITANAEKNDPSVQSAPPSASTSTTNALPPHASLPPRPQAHTLPGDETPSYHAVSALPPASGSYRQPAVAPSLIAAGAPGTSTDPRGGLPPPPGTSYSDFNRPPSQGQFPTSFTAWDEANDPEKRWGPEVQRLYDTFLEEERKNVTEGTWEKFPVGSRLFVGNLASEQVTKRDVFHIFHHYGKIAQISIKQAYGFVQYYSAEACQQALLSQEGTELRGKKIHLEVSKPQKSQQRNSTGGQGDRGQNDRNRQGRNDRNDRDGRGARDEYSRPLRSSRDDYRPQRRSISPPRGHARGRDSWSGSGGRDSYNGRDSRDRRERSPPYDNRGAGGYRERDLSPRRDSYSEPDLQIPHRDPRNVPDVQFIIVEQLNRDFVTWCENEIRSRGVRTETLFLSPRVSLDAVLQRQVVEGVLAVSQLDLRAQHTSKISLKVFNRSAGVNNVRFDEYQGLDPKIAAELVLREKQTQHTQPQYAPPQYGQPQPTYQPVAPPAQQQAPNLSNLVGTLDNATLQKLLGSMNAAPQQNAPAVAQNSQLDLVSLLGMLNQQQQQQPQPVQPQAPPQQAYAQQPPQPSPYNYAVQSPVNAYPAQAAPPPQGANQGSAQSVQNIMAALAKARQ